MIVEEPAAPSPRSEAFVLADELEYWAATVRSQAPRRAQERGTRLGARRAAANAQYLAAYAEPGSIADSLDALEVVEFLFVEYGVVLPESRAAVLSLLETVTAVLADEVPEVAVLLESARAMTPDTPPAGPLTDAAAAARAAAEHDAAAYARYCRRLAEVTSAADDRVTDWHGMGEPPQQRARIQAQVVDAVMDCAEAVRPGAPLWQQLRAAARALPYQHTDMVDASTGAGARDAALQIVRTLRRRLPELAPVLSAGVIGPIAEQSPGRLFLALATEFESGRVRLGPGAPSAPGSAADRDRAQERVALPAVAFAALGRRLGMSLDAGAGGLESLPARHAMTYAWLLEDLGSLDRSGWTAEDVTRRYLPTLDRSGYLSTGTERDWAPAAVLSRAELDAYVALFEDGSVLYGLMAGGVRFAETETMDNDLADRTLAAHNLLSRVGSGTELDSSLRDHLLVTMRRSAAVEPDYRRFTAPGIPGWTSAAADAAAPGVVASPAPARPAPPGPGRGGARHVQG